MIEYNDKKIFVDDKEYDFKGLNTSHILWHLQEMFRPERFINNLNETYTMPSHINYMSLAEGDTFDALLVDDKMFRYDKLTESDREEVQDYINKYAYATALVKLNECSNIIGCGLEHEYSLEESYSFISKCYDRLFENVNITSEKGRLVESFGTDGKVSIYEGDTGYIRSAGSNRVIENWKNPFKFENIMRYLFEGAEQDGSNVKISFIDNKGAKMDAIFENTNLNIISAGINLHQLLNKNNLVESYRTGTLLEYHQPFTLKAASLLAYEKSNDLLKLTLKDAFGNKGDVYAKLTIPVDEFIKKYKKKMNDIINEPYAGDNIRETSGFLTDAASDIEALSRVKNMTTDGDDPVLSYKVAPFTPVEGEGEIVSRKRDDRNKFVVAVVDDEGTPYNLVYAYKGSNIGADIEEMNNLADEMDFHDPSDVYSFYSMLDDYGNIERSAKRGISTKDRNYARNVKEEGDIMEGEGVQVSDIAPKVDQNVGTIQVKMKKRKTRKVESDIANFKKSDLLISNMNEQDEFYGARGFIKDEKGHYHFGDYYVTESGKVVHKSKLNESYFSEVNESQEQADEAYYKVNDVALKLQEVKPYIKEGTEADKLYTNITIELNSLQMSLYNEKLKESTYSEVAGKDGIHSYFDMVYGQEPDSEYAKLILQYMKNHDDIRNDIDKIRSAYKDDTDNPEYRKALQDIQDRDMDNTELLHKAERIPEKDRGQLYQDYLKIRSANEDEFAKQRGYDSYEEYEKHMFDGV